jgi:tripartite ATP-independent transporter DctP family solute receptor
VSAAKYTIRFGGAQPVGHPLTELQYKFKELAEKYSNGDIEVKVYHSNQLGGITEVNEAVRDGSVTMSMSSLTYLGGNYNPKFGVTNLPYLVDRKNIDKLFELMDGDFGAQLSKELETNNFKMLGYYQLGFRNITNSKRAVRTPADLEGLKIRLQPNPVHIESFRILGANPIGMDWAEVYSAMQQGVIDGQENPVDIIYMNKFYEVQKYCTLSGHFFDLGGAYINLPYFNKLPKPMQDAVLRAAHEAMLYERKLSTDREAEFVAKLKEKMQVIELTDDELAQFKEKSKPMYVKVKDIVKDDALVDEFLSHFK